MNRSRHIVLALRKRGTEGPPVALVKLYDVPAFISAHPGLEIVAAYSSQREADLDVQQWSREETVDVLH